MNGLYNLITLDYEMDVSDINLSEDSGQFRLSYYPHRLHDFTRLLMSVFGEDAKHSVYADFKPPEQEPDPAFYIHVIEKPLKKKRAEE